MVDRWAIENTFYETTSVQRLGKMLSQFEILKKTAEIPGDLIELGVFKGNSLIRLLHFRDLLGQSHMKKVWAFDLFDKFKVDSSSVTSDIDFVERYVAEAEHPYTIEKVSAILETKEIKNYELVKGNILSTLPDFLRTNPGYRFSFVHLDMDVYEVTKVALTQLIPLISPGGIIMVDDYGKAEGASLALKEQIDRFGFEIRCSPYSANPAYFFVR